MSAVAAVALLGLGVVLVATGAELFFKGLLASASRFGLPTFALTAIVSGLEAENLAAGIATNAKGLPAAAAGTFLGGTTFIALAVAGAGALISPLRARLPAAALLWTAAAPLPMLLLALDGELSRVDGVVLIGWFAVSIAGLARSTPSRPEPRPRGRRWVLRLAGGLGMLTAGGEAVGEGIRRTVSHLGISQSLLGNTAVAASVEAEELARVAVPARRGRSDLALANLTGTVIHFIALNAGVIALVRPLPIAGDTLHLHLPVAAAAPALLALAIGRPGGLGRVTGGVLLALYCGYVGAAIALA